MTILEIQLREDLARAVDSVPARGGGLEDVVRRGRRRGLVTTVAQMVAVTVLAGGALVTAGLLRSAGPADLGSGSIAGTGLGIDGEHFALEAPGWEIAQLFDTTDASDVAEFPSTFIRYESGASQVSIFAGGAALELYSAAGRSGEPDAELAGPNKVDRYDQVEGNALFLWETTNGLPVAVAVYDVDDADRVLSTIIAVDRDRWAQMLSSHPGVVPTTLAPGP